MIVRSAPPRPGSARTFALGVVPAAAGVVAWWATGATLPLPADISVDGLSTWAGAAGLATVAFTGLRFVAGVLLAWVIATAALGLVGRHLRMASLTRALDRVSLPGVRRFANAVAGAAVVAASLSPAAAVGATTTSPPQPTALVAPGRAPSPVSSPPSTDAPRTRARPGIATMTDLGPVSSEVSPTTSSPAADPARATDPAPADTGPLLDRSTTTTSSPAPPEEAESTAVVGGGEASGARSRTGGLVAPDGQGPATTTPRSTSPAPSSPVTMADIGPAARQPPPARTTPGTAGAPAVPAPLPPGGDDRPVAANGDLAPGGSWVVQPGDHLWHVAEHTTSARLGRPASLGETASYLDRLIAANASRLAVPGHPDLVFAGQEFTLP